MNILKRMALCMSCALLFSCAEEPFGEVADVVRKDMGSSSGTITIAIKEDMRDLARRNDYKIYGRVSMHSLDAKKPDCSEVFVKHLPRRDMSRDEKQLYETGWVSIHDTAIVSYRQQGNVIFVSIIGSRKEVRCNLTYLDSQLKAHVHFLGAPMPFGSSDEGMLGLDVIVPPKLESRHGRTAQ